MLYFLGFNTHYGNSRLKVSFRISTKCIRGLLSSLLNAFHRITSWRNTVHPCQNFRHRTSRQALFCTFIFAACAFILLPLFKTAAWGQASACTFILLHVRVCIHFPTFTKYRIPPCLTFPGPPCQTVPSPVPTQLGVHVVCWRSASCP